MVVVKSLLEAKKFFLKNHVDNCMCVDGNRREEVGCYMGAEDFFEMKLELALKIMDKCAEMAQFSVPDQAMKTIREALDGSKLDKKCSCDSSCHKEFILVKCESCGVQWMEDENE